MLANAHPMWRDGHGSIEDIEQGSIRTLAMPCPHLFDHIATVTLARPEKLNAFNTTMRHELLAAFDDIDTDDDVRAVQERDQHTSRL
jgi:1,4-dihydroxy-2-naphthoyl-CoA synthase